MILYHWYCITIPQISWGNWDTERLGDLLQVAQLSVVEGSKQNDSTAVSLTNFSFRGSDLSGGE